MTDVDSALANLGSFSEMPGSSTVSTWTTFRNMIAIRSAGAQLLIEDGIINWLLTEDFRRVKANH